MMERFRISDCFEGETDIRKSLLSPKEREKLLREIELSFISPKERETLIQEAKADLFKFNVHWFHFKEGLTQQEIADRMGVSVYTIYRCFRREGWTPRNSTKKIDLDHEEVSRLYHDEGLTQQEVADKLGVSLSTVYRHFKKHDMEPHRIISRDEIDSDEVHRLHFEERLTQKEIAERLGVCEHTISRVFRDEGWTAHGQLKYLDEKEREQARKESRRKTQIRITELRESFFGTKCQICAQERKIAVHKKDGVEHDHDALWRISFLKSVNPDEWAALCIPCHRGVHWLMSDYGLNWDEIRFRATTRNHSEFKMQALNDPTMDADANYEYTKIRQEFEGTDEELRRAIFGDRCFFCRVRDDEKRIVLHRKDGRPHTNKLTSQAKYFRTLDPINWVILCQKHHRYVHWAMDTLGLKWDYLKEPRRKSDGAEGEI